MPKIFKGCELVEPNQLNDDEFMPTIERTKTYYPLPHIQFYYTAIQTLTSIGIGVVTNSFGLTPKRDRMFMWLETDAQVNGMPLCIGGRNSYDKSMSAGLCVGTKILVCSNKVLASYENGGVVSRKHTSAENIDELSKEFSELLFIQTSQRKDTLFNRLNEYENSYMSDLEIKSTLVELVLSKIIAPTDIELIYKERVNPRHKEFWDKGTRYQFLMACTEVFKLHKGADYQIKAYDGVAKALGL